MRQACGSAAGQLPRGGRHPALRLSGRAAARASQRYASSAARPLPPPPPPVSAVRSPKANYDAVVVGGGVIGCSTAHRLAAAGASVLVIERRAIAAEQSSKSWGFCRQQGRDLRELPMMVESIRAWEQIEPELGWAIGWQQGGNLALCAAGDEKKATSQAAWVAAAKQLCPEMNTEVVGPAVLAELLPGLADSRYASGMWTPDDGTVDPEKATAAFAAAAAAHGAEFLLGEGVSALQCRDGVVTGVELVSGASVSAKTVVLAAAGWSDELLRWSATVDSPWKVLPARVASLPHTSCTR